MEEASCVDKEAGILDPGMSHRTSREHAKHWVLEAAPGMIIDRTGTREQEGGVDLSKDDHDCEANRKVTSRQGIPLIGSARHVAKGENLARGDMAKDEMHCDRWRELTIMQEQDGMYHTMVVPTKSRMSGTQRFKRRIEGSIGKQGETMWNIKRKRETRYEWIRTPGTIVTNSEQIAKEWNKQNKLGTNMISNQRDS